MKTEDSDEWFAHESATVENGVTVGTGTRIWHYTHIRSGAIIGGDCVLGMNVFIDADVRIGSGTKIQNNVSVYAGVTLDDDVFVGPSAVFTNDPLPRARSQDWEIAPTYVSKGASIGANATILAGVNLGIWSLIGAGAVVTKDVLPHEIVVGSPARRHGWVCRCGKRRADPSATRLSCNICSVDLKLPTESRS